MKNLFLLKIICLASVALITSAGVSSVKAKDIDPEERYIVAPNEAGGQIVLTFKQNYCLPYLDYAPGKRLYDGYITAPNLPKRYLCWTNQINKGYVDVVFLDAGKDGLSARASYDEGYFKVYNPDGTEYVPMAKNKPKPDFNTTSTFRMFDHTTGYLH